MKRKYNLFIVIWHFLAEKSFFQRKCASIHKNVVKLRPILCA